MTHLSSTLSDPLSQFQQFNWSLNLFSESDAPPTSKTAGSSALQSLTYSENEAVALSPIGSQCYSNQSSLSTKSSNDSSAQVGGSAQLRQLTSNGAPESSTEVAADTVLITEKGKSGCAGPFSHPPVLDSVPKTLQHSSPRVFPRHRNSSTSQLNSASCLSGPSPHVSKPSSTLTRANSIATSSVATSHEHQHQPLPRSPTTLWMGDLESWMDEDYVRRCLMMTGLNLPHFVTTSPTGMKTDVGLNGVNVKIKMISGASPSSAYCFLTYPTAEMAEHAWRMISSMPPTLMPGCERTFKLNWATGLPGVQPTWDREFSVFIRDLDRDVTEGELVALFTCSFPSTKSAKIMGDLSTGLSRGYAFIRFGEENDMHRALALGRSKNGTGLFLRGRCIKITEASGSSGTAGDHSHHRTSTLSSGVHKLRSDHSAVSSHANRQEEYTDNRFNTMSNARMTVNPAQDNSIRSVRSNREGFHHLLAGGLSSSTTSLRSSSGYPSPTAGINTSCMPANALSNDAHTPNFLFNGDALPQPLRSMGQLSSSMSALRISPSYPSHSTASKSAQIHPVPANPASFARTFSPCTSIMEPTQSTLSAIPTLYPPSLSHPACGPTPQGLLPSPQAQFTPHAALYPALGSPLTNPTPLPNRYIPSIGLFHSSGEASFNQSTQSYHRLIPTFDSTTSIGDALASQNSINSHLAALTQIASVANDASNDPSNTTVFVGGLPACISEGTLKTFFQNFGEITYVKIPPNKGCGFVQYARREDAQQALLKMHDFPIHGKSRIRLSWGRSLGDKQVEYVKKLSSALGISFESVWKIVQGQDPSMIKQIASTLSSVNGSLPPLMPPVRQNASAIREQDQPPLPSPHHGVMASLSRQSSYFHRLPTGQSMPLSRESFSSPPLSAGNRGSWQGFSPNTKYATSLDLSHSIGASDIPVGLRGCRTPSSVSYESIPTTQANALRLFDKTWGFPI